MVCPIATGDRRRASCRSLSCGAGFTLIELLVVMAVLALLMTLVAPRYLMQTDRAREAVLRNNLKETRDAIDKYRADTGRYPESLQALVTGRYLKSLPHDPFTGQTNTWKIEPPPAASADKDTQGVADLRSGSDAKASDGTPVAQW
jgi:general secretion pathway protein G